MGWLDCTEGVSTADLLEVVWKNLNFKSGVIFLLYLNKLLTFRFNLGLSRVPYLENQLFVVIKLIIIEASPGRKEFTKTNKICIIPKLLKLENILKLKQT